jgi:hypothetical protein
LKLYYLRSRCSPPKSSSSASDTPHHSSPINALQPSAIVRTFLNSNFSLSRHLPTFFSSSADFSYPPDTPLRRLLEGVEKFHWITTKNPLDYDSRSNGIEKNSNGLQIAIQLNFFSDPSGLYWNVKLSTTKCKDSLKLKTLFFHGFFQLQRHWRGRISRRELRGRPVTSGSGWTDV